MNVSGLIKSKVSKFRAQRNKSNSEKLYNLKKKRTRLEGEAKISGLLMKEKNRIKNARKDYYNNKFSGLKILAKKVKAKKGFNKSVSFDDKIGVKDKITATNKEKMKRLYG